MDFIKRNLPKQCKTLFDIGAHTGAFLALAKRNDFRIAGIEPSRQSVKEAKIKYGIRIINGLFGASALKSIRGKYDIVTMCHVLEHTPDPVSFIRTALKITKPGKYLFIEVPDTARPPVDNIVDFFTFQHLFHFTKGTLLNTINALDLKIIAFETPMDSPFLRILIKNEKLKRRTVVNNYKRSKKIMMRYVAAKTRFIEHVKSKIPGKLKEIILYGAGQHTSQLFESGLIDNIRIDAIVDSNPGKQGKYLNKILIQNPKILSTKTAPVLISSRESQEEISKYLHANFPHIAQIKLYDSK